MALDRSTNYIGHCDHCPARTGEVYTPFPTCRECMDQVCPNCQAPGTLIDVDGAPDAPKDSGTVVCKRCTLAPSRDCEATFDCRHRGTDFCTACGYQLPDEDTRDARCERANRVFGETHGGQL